ncbi:MULTISPECIES: hypothetical protein [unclassified Carboxylicivirga]|uniref:hypothetical protein n=1 Tax=Carboxylicivirga TaxID=1628153 RepID=UPI003D34B143
MLIEIDYNTYCDLFPDQRNPFITSCFIELNRFKADELVCLVEEVDKPEMGLIAGVKDKNLLSPFSAPFGGFHYKKENIYVDRIDAFISSLKRYFYDNTNEQFQITLPPDIYTPSFNAKCISSFVRSGFTYQIPEITSWVDLRLFNNRYKQKNSREYYRQSLRNKLVFDSISSAEEQEIAYGIIKQNRARYDRPIFMTLEDIRRVKKIWAVDFFKVTSPDGLMVASAIFYRFHSDIVFALFWGDNEHGRSLRAMDFMLFNLWKHYKELSYKYVDLGISTEQSIPNVGLLRFKETHEAISSLKYSFSLNSNPS